MVSRFSLAMALVYLAIYGTLVPSTLSLTTAEATPLANSPSQATYPSYSNAAVSSSSNIISSDEVAGASNTAITYVSGSAAIESCILAWVSWVSASVEMQPGYSEAQTQSLTTSYTTVTSTFYSTYTLCDGIPRIVLDGPLNYSTCTVTDDWYTPEVVYSYDCVLEPSPVVVSTVVTDSPFVEVAAASSTYDTCTFTDDYSTPAYIYTYECETSWAYTPTTTLEPLRPNCHIDASDCASLSAASSNAMFTGGGINSTASPTLFACQTVFTDWILGPDSYPCNIEIPLVQLIYWPVTLASQDLCVYPEPIDITAIQSNTPVVASAFGINITSDENCYISYPIAIAVFPDYSVETAPGGIVAVPSSNLKSFRNSQYGYANLFTYSFNFADLPPNPVPVLAYEAGLECYTYASYGLMELDPACETIYEALYTPQLSFPSELSAKFPQWASCDFNLVGLYDPPTSLVPMDFLTPPSTASPTIGASPGSTGDPITPSATAVAVTEAPSPTTATDSDPTSGGGHGTGFDNNGDSPTGADTSLATVVTFGNSGGSVVAISVSNADGVVVLGSGTLFPGQVTIIDGQTVSALPQGPGIVVDGQTVSVPSQGTVVVYDGSADSSDPATAVFTLGDGTVVTATSLGGANGFIVVGSQTLTAGQAFTTAGAVLSVVDGGLLLSSGAFESTGAILTVNSKAITALESVNRGSTVIDVGGYGEIAVGGPAITVAGVVLSAGDNGLVITSAGGTTTVLYSTVPLATSTPPKSSDSSIPKSSTSSHTTTAIAVTPTSKKGGSSRTGIGMGVLVVLLFAALGFF